jgi:leader peptidase (prepilin peptidase)/N-methyltransferase
MMLFLFFIAGAVVGSFLNVCIVRMPQEKSIVFPGSHCVHCSKPVAWFDNIPLVSWIVLGGKCRNCKQPIAFRYWLVELLTALVFAGFYQYFGLTPVLFPYLIMVSCFIVATFVDFGHRIIPDEVSVGGMYAGIVLSVLIPLLHPVGILGVAIAAFIAGGIVLLCVLLTLIYPVFCKQLMEEHDPSEDHGVKYLVIGSLLVITAVNYSAPHLPLKLVPVLFSLSSALSGYIIGGGLIYAMGLFGDILFKKESMGGGDVKLMAMIGAFMGWQMAVLTFFLAPFFGAVYGIIEKIRTKDSTMAYGPFIVLGALICLFWGKAIIAWIMRGGMYGG